MLTEELKNKKGITLIALVITIVVLIILAAVSIAMLTGENGLITKAEQAKDQTDLAGIREELQIMWQELLIETNNGRGYTEKEIAPRQSGAQNARGYWAVTGRGLTCWG